MPDAIEAAEELTSLVEEEDLEGVALLLLANKQDLLGVMSAADIMEELDVSTIKTRWVHVQGCSAKTGEGLEDGVLKLQKHLDENKE